MSAATTGSPLTARRSLAARLRALRDQNGLTTEEVGEHLSCHNSKISRLERGQRTVAKRDFESLMDLYEVDEPERGKLHELMIRSRQKAPPWWYEFADVISVNYGEFLAYEAESARCWEHQPLLLPGLVQTADYARAVTDNGVAALGPDQVDTLVQVRLRRQQRLHGPGAMGLDVLVTEASLRLRVGGPATMREQLDHLIDMAGWENISLRVIPFTAGADGVSTGAFQLFATGADQDADVAFLESAEATTAFRDDPLAVRRLSRLYGKLAAIALSEEESRTLVARVKKEMEEQ